MPTFQYRAARPTGEVVEGEMDGVDDMTVMRALQAQGLVPIRAQLKRAPRAPGTSWWRRDSVTGHDIELVAGELAMLLDAGVALDRALGMMAELTPKPTLAAALHTLEDAMRQGQSFPDALAEQPELFPNLLVNLSRAGEAGGRLSEALARAATYLEAARTTRENLTSALLYPALLCFLAFGSVVLMVAFVVPRFANLFEEAGVPLPLATQILAEVGQALTSYGWAFVLAGVALVIGIRRTLARPGPRAWLDRKLLVTPVVGALIAKIEGARFARIMSTLLASGTAVPNALAIAEVSAGNQGVSERLARVAQGVRAGHRMAEQLEREAVFPRLTGQLLRIGEESDRLVEVLDKLGEMFEKDVDRGMKRAITLIEPALILVVGLIVGAVVFGVLSAVLSVNELT